ncbi:condensation domain-containing protein, partial [Nonomuraea sp. NPDC002799]
MTDFGDDIEQSLIRRLLAEAGLDHSRPAAPVIRPAGGPLVLSSGQERLWFLDQWRPGSAAYNVPIVLRLNGSVDNDRLRTAVETIVRRHTVLRMTLTAENGRPHPLISDTHLPWQETETDNETSAWQLVQDAITQPFDLSTGPLLRAGLIHYDTDNWLLWLSIHHIACDGWSLTILLNELTTLYTN